MNSCAAIPQYLSSSGNRFIARAGVVLGGALLLSFLAQIAIPLPWTPVPITGQTLGVAILALLWGRDLGVASMILYLGLSAAGLPILAQATPLTLGPTLGYLIGMLLASLLVGRLSDMGFARTFRSAFFCCVAGSAVTFLFGLFVLSRFVPSNALFAAGLLPFIPGDLIKNTIAATVAARVNK